MSHSDYPSIISQQGSAERNIEPLISVLRPLLSVPPSASTSASTGTNAPRRILELGSFPYTQIEAFAHEFGDWQWHGTVREEHELRETNARLSTVRTTTSDPNRQPEHPRDGDGEGADRLGRRGNLHDPVILDIAHEEHWELREVVPGDTSGRFEGVLMVNLVHCLPPHLPEQIFKHLSPLTEAGRSLLAPTGFVACYSPFLDDAGGYKSASDEKFDKEYIKAKHASLGLRSVPDISAVAVRWGFREEYRVEMARGNMFVVWRAA